MSFLGIALPADVCRLFRDIDCPGKKVDMGTYHITMLYIGDNTPISVVTKAIEVAAPVMQGMRPFDLQVRKVGHFPVNPDDQPGHPVIARVDSPMLHELRDELAQAFDDREVPYSKKFPDFKPHVTLSYSDEPYDADLEEPIKWTCSEAVLWAGDDYGDRFVVTFQLPREGPKYEGVAGLENEIRSLLNS
jgi:2'-5' RNA ligase